MSTLRRVAAFLCEERAGDLPSKGIQIGLWVVAALGVLGIAYAKVISPMMQHASDCANTAAGSVSGISTGSGATLAGC